MNHQQIENFLLELRESHVAMEDVFKMGSCYHLFAILRVLDPTAKPWWHFKEHHVYIEIGGRLYDIRGQCFPNKEELKPLFTIHTNPLGWRDKKYEKKTGFAPSNLHWNIRLSMSLVFILKVRKWLHPFRYYRYKREQKERLLDDMAWELEN